MFHVWTLLPAIYVYWRFINLLNMSQKYRFLLGLIIIAGCEFHLISRLVFGTLFSPELPELVMLFLGWIFGCTIFFALSLLLYDVCLVLYRGMTRRPVGKGKTVRIAMLAAAGLLSATGVYNAVDVPLVRRVEITLPKLPREFDGFTVVQLTDIHASRLLGRQWVQRVVDETNALNPDLIVITGDMADGRVKDRLNDVLPLALLKAPCGVYAITGNHEYYFDADAWVKAYTHLGLNFLSNSHVRLSKEGVSIVLAGVNDEVASVYDMPGPDLMKALQGVSPEQAVILLDHRPGDAEKNMLAGVSLQLSGHTHGGMIRGLDIAAGMANNGFVSGLYQVGDMALYVSNGAGLWNGFPLRLGKPSEITLITLRGEK